MFVAKNFLDIIGALEIVDKNYDYDKKLDGFLWGVPKHRKSIHMRWKKKHGPHPRYKCSPREDILTCLDCGHFHLKGCLCENCYQKVKYETHNVLKHINPLNEYKPIEQDVHIKYNNDDVYENQNKEFKFVNGKMLRVVEIDKPRPLWFHQNLLSKIYKK
ncbi:unnamed protein product [Gordionus sp. m RMFG-2023]